MTLTRCGALLLLLASCLPFAYAQSAPLYPLLLPTETDPLVQQWAEDTARAFLATHQLQPSDGDVMLRHARQDVLDNLRAFAWIRIQGMANDPDLALSPSEQAVMNRILSLVQQNRTKALDEAIAEKNRFLADRCNWKVDPDIGKAAAFTYDGAYYCPQALYARIFDDTPPPISPPKDLFLAIGQKRAWVDPFTARPGGLRSILHVTEGGITFLTIGISASILIGVLAGVAISFEVVRVLIGLVRLGQGASVAAGPVTYALIGVTIALTLIVIAITVFLFTENNRIEGEYAQLESTRQALSAQPPVDRAQLKTLTNTAATRGAVYAGFLDQVLPKFSIVSTAPLPTRTPGIDPVFVIANGPSTSPSDTIVFNGWEGEKYRVRMWGGWFLSETLVNRSYIDPASVNLRLRFSWRGKKYEAIRMGPYFAVNKKDPEATDLECPANRTTKVSSSPDLSLCRTFVALNLPMDLDIGTRAVSISQPVRFTSATTTGVSLGAARDFAVNTVGGPPATVSVRGSLPSGFTFTPSGSGGLLSWSGTGTTGDYTIVFSATNGVDTVTQNLSVQVAQFVRFIEPQNVQGTGSVVSLTRQAGTFVSIPITAVGFPVPSVDVSPIPVNSPNGITTENCGLALTSNNASTVLSGWLAQPLYSNKCSYQVNATSFTSQSGAAQFTLELNVAEAASQPALLTSSLPARVSRTTNATILTSGASGPVSISRYTGSVDLPLGAGAVPSWVNLTDNGDGTANVSINPPANAPDRVYLPLWVRVTGTRFNQNREVRSDYVWIDIVRKPAFADKSAVAVFRSDATSPAIFTFTAENEQGSIAPVDPLPSGFSVKNPVPGAIIITGKPSQAMDIAASLRATNPWGTDTIPLRLIVTQPAAFTSPTLVNFYLGRNNSFTLNAIGYPIAPLADVNNAALPTPMRIWGDIPQAPWTPEPNVMPWGLKFSTTDANGAPLYGSATITGSPLSLGFQTVRFYAQTADLPIASQDLTMFLTLPGDVSSDFKVDCADVTFITSRMGQRRGMPKYNYNADYNQDGVIDVRDLAMVSANLPKGTRCQ